MCVYHERLHVPAAWWALGAVSLLIFGGELAAGGNWLTVAVVCLALTIPSAAVLALWGHAAVTVGGGELRAGRARLPLGAVGQVAPLDQAQTRAIRGPRADPSARVISRPYLRVAVFVEIAEPQGSVPYWLVGSRNPDALAAAIERSRPGARADGAAVG